MTVKTIVLGDDDTIVKFKINGVEFECFPLDDIEFINAIVIPADGEELKGEAFCRVIQERLKLQYGVTASLLMASRWYNALHEASKEQEAFFEGSPALSAPTDLLPQAGEATGASDSSATTSSGSLNSPSHQSKRKSNRKPSSTSTKTKSPAGTT